MRSRRCPVKVMCLGVVADPQEEHEFDGRVCMERVSNQKTATRRSTNQRFSDDVHVNTAMMNGDWRELLTEEMKVEEAMEMVSQTCDLDEHVSERLKMNCKSYNGNGKKETKTLNNNVVLGELGMRTNEDGDMVPLLLEDLN